MKCQGCDEDSFLIPLHGDKGGPMRCPLCVGKWNAEHGRRRRTGRVVIRAMKAFFDAGGKLDDVEKLKWSAQCGDWGEFGDQLGYMDGIAEFDGAPELTAELLAEVLQLVHPDHQPPERQDMARRVTQQLLALQPFVFPARKLKPVTSPGKDDDWISKRLKEKREKYKTEAKPRYPCADCADAVPRDYCDACRAEWEKLQEKAAESARASWRHNYARRRQWALIRRPKPVCAGCGKKFESKRNDARYCSARCRQKAHREAVTDKHIDKPEYVFNRDKAARHILALVDRHRAIWLNDLLPEGRTRAQYQTVALIAAKLEAEGKIEGWYYDRFWSSDPEGKFKALVQRGLNDELKRDDVHRISDEERLRLD
jgi:hypothetical protein